MKKLLIFTFMVLIIICVVFTVKSGFTIGQFKVLSFSEIKNLNAQTEATIAEAEIATLQTYKSKVTEFETAIKKLTQVKQDYEKEVAYTENGTVAGITIKKHKIEHLWTVLGLYATNNNVDLSFDVSQTNTKDEENLYNLEFTIFGEYSNTISFLSNIINDDTLDFSISKFNMLPSATVASTTKTETTKSTAKTNNTSNTADENTTSVNNAENTNNTNNNTNNGANDYAILQTTFSVQNIGIEFD